MVNDPGEKQDLAADKPEIVMKLQNWRKQWWASVVEDQKKIGIQFDPQTLQPLSTTGKK